MVAGFEKFKEHFGAFQDEFIIIGGTAVQLVRGESISTVSFGLMTSECAGRRCWDQVARHPLRRCR